MSTAPEDNRPRELRRRLGVIDGVAVLIGIVLGSGIFVAPSAVAAVTASPVMAAGLWLIFGVVACCGGAVYAECGARLPRDGGFIVFYREAYGDGAAFVAGWTALVVTYPASIAAIARACGNYAATLMPSLAGREKVVAIAVILATGALHAAGVRAGAWGQRLLTGVKIAALAAVLVAAFLAAPAAHAAAPVVASGAGPGMLTLLISAATVMLWSYDGWSDTPMLAGELRDPARALGRALVIAMSVIVTLYVAVQVAVMTLLPVSQAVSSQHVFTDAVEVALGGDAGRLVALLVVVTTAGSVSACSFTASRIAYAMAREGAFFEWFGGVSRRETPVRSVAILVALTVTYSIVGGFDDLLAIFTFSVWLFYALTAVALLRLRRRGVGEPVPWRAPLGPAAPVVVIAASAFMAAGLMRDDPKRSLIGLGLLALGVPAYMAWKRFRAARAA